MKHLRYCIFYIGLVKIRQLHLAILTLMLKNNQCNFHKMQYTKIYINIKTQHRS